MTVLRPFHFRETRFQIQRNNGPIVCSLRYLFELAYRKKERKGEVDRHGRSRLGNASR